MSERQNIEQQPLNTLVCDELKAKRLKEKIAEKEKQLEKKEIINK